MCTIFHIGIRQSTLTGNKLPIAYQHNMANNLKCPKFLPVVI